MTNESKEETNYQLLVPPDVHKGWGSVKGAL